MNTPNTPPLTLHFAALVRGDDGGLTVRWFRTQEEATAACCAHEVAPPKVSRRDARSMSTTHELAHDLGIAPARVRKWVIRHDIPRVCHGPRSIMIPNRICRLVKLYGLQGVAHMAQRGELMA